MEDATALPGLEHDALPINRRPNGSVQHTTLITRPCLLYKLLICFCVPIGLQIGAAYLASLCVEKDHRVSDQPKSVLNMCSSEMVPYRNGLFDTIAHFAGHYMRVCLVGG